MTRDLSQYVFNEYQSSLEELKIDQYPEEIQELFFDFINTVPYIKNLIAVDRPRAKDLPRDEDGKIVVDLTNPPIIEDIDFFRPVAKHFEATGKVCNLRPNPNPNSEYGKWVREEVRRCYEGYVRPSDGAWVTGDMYFFLNYCPIMKAKRSSTNSKKGSRVEGFPDFWEGHFLKFHYMHQARENAKHGSELASRGVGKSFTMAALAAKRFLMGESKEASKRVETFVASYRKDYLNDDGILNKFESYIDWCAENTEFPRKRLISSMNNMHWQSGYKENASEAKKGSLNEVIGVSVKDSEGKLRGKRGAFIGLEEFGCHIEGTEVLMYDGTLKKVEDIQCGELLMGDDNTARKVLTCHSGEDTLYKITLSNGDYQIVNSKHLIYFKKYDWNKKQYKDMLLTPKEVMSIKNLDKGHYIIKANIKFPKQEVPIHPYWLGLWLGDGDKYSSTVSNEDIEVISWVQEYAESQGLNFNKRYLPQSTRCYDLDLSGTLKDGKTFRQTMKDLGILGNKFIPTIYKINDESVLLNVIAGFIDTDGTYCKSKRFFEITQKHDRKHIIEDIKFMCDSLGFKTSVTTRISGKHSKNPGTLHYRLRISGNVERIPTKIARKKAEAPLRQRVRRNWSEYTFKVEKYGIGKYYGFTVDKNNLFVLKDFSIVHNSFPNLIGLYGTLRPSMEDGDVVFGMIYCLGCVCAGTKVFDKYGNLINIEDANSSIMGYNGVTASVEEITYLQPEAYKECVEIITTNGSLKCSVDHPLLTLNKNIFNKSTGTCSFYRANELKPGDILLMHGNDKFGDIHVKDAYLLGALFGDGNYSNSSCVSLSITTEEEYEYYNKNYSINISKLKNTANGGLYAQIYFRGLHPLLKTYNMDKQSFENKKLPNNIWQWDKPSIANFLAGYFDADGNIQIVKTKHRSIKLTCKYKETLESVSILLQKFGIYSYILEETKPERVLYSTVNNKEYKVKSNKVYVLYICNGRDIINFRENIHLKIASKRERLYSYVLQKGKGYYPTLKFKYRKENSKGKYFIDKDLLDLKGTKIISINNIGILRIYNLTANTTHTYLSNGFISSNTAGDKDSDFAAAQKIMYSPRAFNMYPVLNVYDKVGQGRPEFVFFFPAYINRNGCYNKDGISDVTKALLEILINRYTVKYNSTDLNLITKTISEHPIVPQEAILRSRGNMFPVTQLTERLNELDKNPNGFDSTYIGTLVLNSKGEIEFTPTMDNPIREFPLNDNKYTGALEIYEMPQKDNLGKVFAGRYIMGLDPVNNDLADTLSLTSVFVLDLFTDRIVAEYTGRTDYVEDALELVRKLCIFYNAKCLYENNIKGPYAYFSSRRCLHYLADTPEYLRDKQIIKYQGFGNTSKGVAASTPVNNYANGLIREWLIKPVTIVVNEDGLEVEKVVTNMAFVRNRALLQELINYNPDGNFDRIRALGMVMLYRGEFVDKYEGDLSRTGLEPETQEDDYFKEYDLMLELYKKL